MSGISHKDSTKTDAATRDWGQIQQQTRAKGVSRSNRRVRHPSL